MGYKPIREGDSFVTMGQKLRGFLTSVPLERPALRPLVGSCERCRAYGPLYVVPSGALSQPYLCERCAKAETETP